MTDRCPACKSSDIESFFKRSDVPVHQNLLMPTMESAISIPRGILNLHFCRGCGFIFNEQFDAAKLQYGGEYENNQACSPYFNGYLDGLIQDIHNSGNAVNCNIVEIGCGNGLFLKKLVGGPDTGNRGVGFDLSYSGPDTDLDGRLEFRRNYFSPEDIDFSPDIIICRHVIEHVCEPLEMLIRLKDALAKCPGARLFFETPCVEWILSNTVIWDFFYEHCSYFSDTSIRSIFASAGFEVARLERVFNGQYMWLEISNLNSGRQTTERKGAGNIPDLSEKFKDTESRIIERLKHDIDRLRNAGNVAVWGAGAKGATLVNIVDPGRELISCVIDINPKKNGHYIPGSGHKIVGYKEAWAMGVNSAILMNPNYLDENTAFLKKDEINISLHELV